MGCDIHLYQEKRVDGRWLAADKWELDKYGDFGVDYNKRLYTGRNYRLFAVLANVRNGFGFAGIKTGDAVVPIAMPRGIPDDACKEIAEDSAEWGSDGHSHSWLTLADIDGYDWTQGRRNIGCVTLDVYRRWKASGDEQPQEWSGSVSGPRIQHISESDAATWQLPDPDNRVYVTAEWTTSAAHNCKEFLDAVRPRLEELERECGAGNARIVFWFDN